MTQNPQNVGKLQATAFESTVSNAINRVKLTGRRQIRTFYNTSKYSNDASCEFDKFRFDKQVLIFTD